MTTSNKAVRVEFTRVDGQLGCGCCSYPSSTMTVTRADGSVENYDDLHDCRDESDVRSDFAWLDFADDCDFSDCSF